MTVLISLLCSQNSVPQCGECSSSSSSSITGAEQPNAGAGRFDGLKEHPVLQNRYLTGVSHHMVNNSDRGRQIASSEREKPLYLTFEDNKGEMVCKMNDLEVFVFVSFFTQSHDASLGDADFIICQNRTQVQRNPWTR